MTLFDQLAKHALKLRRTTWEKATITSDGHPDSSLIYRANPRDYGWEWKPTLEDLLADNWERVR